MEFPDWAAVVLALLIALYVYGTWHHSHFVHLKLPFLPPLPFVGNMGPTVFRTQPINETIKEIYNTFEGSKMNGFFNMGFPTVMLRDPEIIKQIMVKDFEYFTDHRQLSSEDDLFGRNLFVMKGDKWKNMRHTLSPAFTSSKMKNMFLLIAKCGQQMADHLDKKCKAENGVLSLEMKEFYTKYTNDVIATSAFGIHVDSLEQPDNEFYTMGKAATDINPLRFFFISMAPELMKKFGLSLITENITNFFRTLVHGTIATREKEGIVRPDMIHLLMQARKEDKNAALTDDDITAQAFLFFFAGFDTASTLLCFMTHLLAMNPDIQDRVRAEVDEVLAQHNGEINYEGMQQLKYLDTVMSETLRLWPPAVFTDRVCTRPYTIQATESSPAIKLNRGDNILTPVFALHRDPKYFPDPERFDPERFNDENKGNINPFAYLPFGLGPRNCIGMRFAQMEAKIAMTVLISRFELTTIDKTPNPIKIDKTKINLNAEGGFWLGIKQRAQDAK